MTPRRFTSSELRQWQLCRRSWYLKHFLGYGPKRDHGEVSASRTGTLVHKGLEVFYRDGFEEEAAVAHVGALVEANAAALAEAGHDSRVKQVQGQGELARIMLEGYFEWVAETGADADLEITGAEQRIEVPFQADYYREQFGVEVSLLGLADLLAVRRSTGKRVILDAKSVQSAGDQEVLAPMSPQFKHYAVILEMLGGEHVDGALVRWLRRVKRTARATPPFYGEVPVMWPKDVLRSYYRHTAALIEEILTAEKNLRAGVSPDSLGIGPTVTRDCGRCVFRPVCPLLDDETVDETDVLAWSYERVDPLARYSAEESEDE